MSVTTVKLQPLSPKYSLNLNYRYYLHPTRQYSYKSYKHLSLPSKLKQKQKPQAPPQNSLNLNLSNYLTPTI